MSALRPVQEQDLSALERIHSISFAVAGEGVRAWWERAGHDLLRVYEVDGTVVAGLLDIPMGAFFGGRSVSTHGVAGVGTAPEARGYGHATAMMRAYVRDLHQRGVALSSLYPATEVLYRAAGYETAGSTFRFHLALEALERTRGLEVRPLEEAHQDEVEALYRATARHRHGWLDRGRYIWDRVRHDTKAPTWGLGVFVDGVLEGYLYYSLRRVDDIYYEAGLRDLCAATERAARRLLGLVADHGSMARAATWQRGDHDPILDLLSEPRHRVELVDHWMIRVVDVIRALEERGWPAGVDAELHLEVDDPLLPANTGRFVLEVSGGRGRVRPGGDGLLRTRVTDLAPLYTGYGSPWALRSTGRLHGDDESLALAETLFRGTPTMADCF